MRTDFPARRRVFLCAALFTLAACATPSKYFYYADQQAAVASQPYRDKWIPERLPASAVAIHLVFYDYRTSTLLAFEYDGGLGKLLKKECRPQDVGDLFWPTMEAAWWPADLQFAIKGTRADYTYYWCDQERGFYALTPADKTVYFWRP